MITKTFIAAAVTAAAVGSGGVALAGAQGSHAALSVATPSASSSASTTGTGTALTTPAQAATKAGHAGRRAQKAKRHARLGNALHGSWVTKNGKTGKVVTHDAIRGTASAISATSITVTAADKVSQTYAITSKTYVRVFDATTHKPVQSSIGAIKSGQRVRVAGTGTTSLIAKNVVVVKKQK